MVAVGMLLSFIQSGFNFVDFFWVYLLPALGLFALLYLLALGWESFSTKRDWVAAM